jgi:hypothetical protein
VSAFSTYDYASPERLFNSARFVPFSESRLHERLETGISLTSIILWILLIIAPGANLIVSLLFTIIGAPLVLGLMLNDQALGKIVFKIKPKKNNIDLDKGKII